MTLTLDMTGQSVNNIFPDYKEDIHGIIALAVDAGAGCSDWNNGYAGHSIYVLALVDSISCFY